jgi:hypothetical protein
MASQGWPECHRRIKEHIDRIAWAQLGAQKFPSSRVGINWTARFRHRHFDQIKMADSRPLEDKRGQAVNPTANTHYWELLEDTVSRYKIRPDTTFGADEVGVQACGNERDMLQPSTKKRDHSTSNVVVLGKILLFSLRSVLMEHQHHLL